MDKENEDDRFDIVTSDTSEMVTVVYSTLFATTFTYDLLPAVIYRFCHCHYRH